MLEFKTMFISLDICKIWWHSAGVWSFSFCYGQQASKVEKWELLFSCQLPHWTSALTRLSEKGGFVAVSLQTCILLIQCSIILKRAFQLTYNTHLQKVAHTVPTLSISCTGARAEQPQGRNRRVLTQELLLHNQHSNRAQVHKERRSYTNHRHLCGLLQPQHYHMGNPGSWLQLTIF